MRLLKLTTLSRAVSFTCALTTLTPRLAAAQEAPAPEPAATPTTQPPAAPTGITTTPAAPWLPPPPPGATVDVRAAAQPIPQTTQWPAISPTNLAYFNTLGPRPYVRPGWIALTTLGAMFALGGGGLLVVSALSASASPPTTVPGSPPAMGSGAAFGFALGGTVTLGVAAVGLTAGIIGIRGDSLEMARYDAALRRFALTQGNAALAREATRVELRSRVQASATLANVLMGMATLGSLALIFVQPSSLGVTLGPVTYTALALLGTPLVVTLAGNAAGGQGSFGTAFLGSLIGLVVPFAGHVYGATLGYMAAHDSAQSAAFYQPSPAPTVTVGVSPQGLSMSGAF
ncbi:MAG: hypothetical protein Q8Q09_09910 [Deltaproteobacteria bacterium]|nr:hypothetical protein [Deltaproteobacteria bacterium]